MAWNSVVTDRQPWADRSPQMNENADLIAAELIRKGWSLAAVCGLLGNCSIESYLNPGQYELGHGTPTDPYGWGYGVGLIQWTSPDGGRRWPNPWLYYCQWSGKDLYSGVDQCEMIDGCNDTHYTVMDLSTSIWGWMPNSYPIPSITYDDFKHLQGADNVEYACKVWFYYVEWHSPVEDGSLKYRVENALKWWEYFGGVPPVPPEPEKKKKRKIFLMLRKF